MQNNFQNPEFHTSPLNQFQMMSKAKETKNIFLHNIWKANGSPNSGSIHAIKTRSNLQYKYAINKLLSNDLF